MNTVDREQIVMQEDGDDTTIVLISSSCDSEIEKEIDNYVKELRADHYVSERGIMEPRGQSAECLLRCSKASLDFAAMQFKLILSALKANGCDVQFKAVQEYNRTKPTQKVLVTLGQSSEQLRVEEAATRRERTLTASERKERERKEAKGSWFYFANRWIYTPTGKPKLVFGYHRYRVIGKDVSPIVKAILGDLRERNDYATQREIERRHERARYLTKLRRFRRKLWKELQFEMIEQEAKSWSRAERLRGYIARVEQQQDEYEVADWLVLAKKLVDDLDPIASEKFGLQATPPKYAEVEKVWRERHSRYDF